MSLVTFKGPVSLRIVLKDPHPDPKVLVIVFESAVSQLLNAVRHFINKHVNTHTYLYVTFPKVPNHSHVDVICMQCKTKREREREKYNN